MQKHTGIFAVICCSLVSFHIQAAPQGPTLQTSEPAIELPDWPRKQPLPLLKPLNPGAFKAAKPMLDPATGEVIEDPLFEKQYQLWYDGHTIDGFRGWPHLNTNVVDAWAFTKGAGVKVGVMDSGFEPHSDLPPFTGFVSDAED